MIFKDFVVVRVHSHRGCLLAAAPTEVAAFGPPLKEVTGSGLFGGGCWPRPAPVEVSGSNLFPLRRLLCTCCCGGHCLEPSFEEFVASGLLPWRSLTCTCSCEDCCLGFASAVLADLEVPDLHLLPQQVSPLYLLLWKSLLLVFYMKMN